jgi:proteasome lid subunit RPN8/RPN11
MEGSDGAIVEARRIHAVDPDRYFYPDQYNNPANWRAHFEGTGPEIARQIEGRATHFVAGLGTSGTFVGAGRKLRQLIPGIRLVSVQPDSPLHGVEGLKHMATAIVPGIYDPDLADDALEVPTEKAYRLTRQLAREEGLFVGPSSGAALAGCLRIAGSIGRGVIVTIFPDGGDRYLSEGFWEVERQAAAASTGASLRISGGSLLDIRRHGERAYPDECCGALIGDRAGETGEAYALSNTTDGERRRRFLVGPREYREAEARAAATHRELVGFYHSHPDHPAVPSAFDLEHAWPNLSYLIVSVRDGRAAEARSWRLRADRSGFDEERLCQ